MTTTARVIATLSCGCILLEGGTRVRCRSCTDTMRSQNADVERIAPLPEEQPVQARIEELMNDAEREALQSLASGDFFEVARWDQTWAALNQVAAVQRPSQFAWLMELARERLDGTGDVGIDVCVLPEWTAPGAPVKTSAGGTEGADRSGSRPLHFPNKEVWDGRGYSGECVEFPSLKFQSHTLEGAMAGIREQVQKVLAEPTKLGLLDDGSKLVENNESVIQRDKVVIDVCDCWHCQDHPGTKCSCSPCTCPGCPNGVSLVKPVEPVYPSRTRCAGCGVIEGWDHLFSCRSEAAKQQFEQWALEAMLDAELQEQEEE